MHGAGTKVTQKYVSV